MAKKFGESKGQADKGANLFKFKDGANRFRMVGDILPRYGYWLPCYNDDGSKAKSDIWVECLSFDRDKERFTNIEHDYVKDYFPDMKCSWAYIGAVIDGGDGALKYLPHKKKLYSQIRDAADDLGDPTDIDTGWWINVKRSGTGFTTEYSLNQIKSSNDKVPLTEAQKAAVLAAPSLDSMFPRMTPEQIRELIEKKCLPPKGDAEEAAPVGEGQEELPSEFTDDIPF